MNFGMFDFLLEVTAFRVDTEGVRVDVCVLVLAVDNFGTPPLFGLNKKDNPQNIPRSVKIEIDKTKR